MRPAGPLRRLHRLATKRGWTMTEREGKGSHLVVTLEGRRATIPMHARDLKTGTFRGILRDLGLTPDDLEV